MANDKKTSTGALPTTGIVWAVLFVAGVFLAREVPWQVSRPGGAESKVYAYAGKQDIDARLWQDPLGAVARGRADAKKPGDAGDHTSDDLRRQLAARSERTASALVLGVTIPGGAYPESIEFRRRTRYAALAGLNRMGFIPADPEHLGYVLPPPGTGLPEFIAYEWMVAKDDRGPAVLTLWLDENVFGEKSACRFFVLRELLEGRNVACPGAPRSAQDPAYAHPFVVVGPSYTSTLQDLLRTPDPIQRTTDGKLPTFYAYGATADDAAIMNSIGSVRTPDAFRDILANRRLQLYRTIGVDSALGDALKGELQRRGVDPAARAACGKPARAGVEHVVLISERDSLYGRSLPDVMSAEFAGKDCDAGAVRTYVHRFSYLRGLDGQLASGGTEPGPAKSAAKPDVADRDGKAKQIERPEGQSQLDYLRRLSLELAEMDAELRRTGGGAIKAVGVLGSDVYDKLLILQALRPQFQSVLFFTTDLDARMLHPLEQEWARNLIVASNFGFRLNARLQDDILPFRDGYQTSVYLSTQVALHNALAGCPGAVRDGATCIEQDRIDRWLHAPRLYEIGRSTAFDFARTTGTPCTAGPALVGCDDIHPAGSPRYPTVSDEVFRNVVLLVLLGVLLLGLARGFGTRVDHWVRRGRWAPLAGGVVAFGAVVAFAFRGAPLWPALAEHLTEHGAGEPISFLQGVSIWPAETIRLVSAVLSIGFLLWAWRLLDRNLREVAEALRFQPSHVEMVRLVRAAYRGWTPWQRFVRCFSFRLVEIAGGPKSARTGLGWSAQIFWEKYLYQGRFFARCCRVAAAVVLYFVVASVVVSAFGAPNTPFRGAQSQFWNQLILPVSVSLMLFVIFFVVDATVFCHQIVRALQDDVVSEAHEARMSHEPSGQATSLWAASTLAYYREKFGIDGRQLDSWILMDFIARRTAVVAKLIYFPFIVISLMVLSRSPFFDNWTMPVGLVIVLASSVLIVSGCAILLRESAEQARRKVLKVLGDDLVRLKGAEGRTGAQIETMIAQIRALDVGAFAPFSQQPFFRALLLPLSTFGGSALLDWLTLASF